MAKVSIEQKNQTKKAIAVYCKMKGCSLDELAVVLEIPADILRKVEKGIFYTVEDTDWRKIWHVVNPELAGNIFTTKDYQTIENACNTARNQRYMVGITGDTGMGKSTSLVSITLAQPNSYYYYVDGTVTPRVFLKDMLRVIGVSFDGTANAMLNKIADKLNVMNEPLVCIDECGKLSQRMILLLHSLRDKTKNNCGFVLAGMPDWKNSMVKKVERNIMGYAEFFRRINIWGEMMGLSLDEIRFVLGANGITEKQQQNEFRNYKRFGDLMNEIELFKTINQ